MRTVSLAVLVLSLMSLSQLRAADLDEDFLRGPDYEPVPAAAIDWNGVYVGGQVGYTMTTFNFGHAGQSEIAHILRSTAVESQYKVSEWNQLRSRRQLDTSFGGFAGYNLQFDDIVLGVEIDYTSANQKARARDSVGRSVNLTSGLFDDAVVATASRATLEDYGTVRARAGYAFGPFLPFVTGGLAIGRAIVGNSVFVSLNEFNNSTRTTQSGGLIQTGGNLKEKIAVGVTAGGGIDYAITSNIFLRAEYQYVNFNEIGDHKMQVNTVRGAVGVKF